MLSKYVLSNQMMEGGICLMLGKQEGLHLST